MLLIWVFIKLRKANSFNNYLKNENSALTKKVKEFEKRNDSLQRKNSQIIADNALLEAEQLKFQLQPHTLGNVVATLNSIAKNLHRGTESLAESLNYILYKGNAACIQISTQKINRHPNRQRQLKSPRRSLFYKGFGNKLVTPEGLFHDPLLIKSQNQKPIASHLILCLSFKYKQAFA